MSVVISFRISRSLKERMEKLQHINWSEVVRRAIEEVVRREESKLRERDKARMRAAVIRTDKLRRLVPGWSSVEEIRRWRERK